MDIKKLIDETLKEINEGLNEPLNVPLKRTDNGYVGSFEVEGNKYLITFIETTDDCFICDFTKDGDHNLVNDLKKAFTVIPTIEKSVTDFIDRHRPKLFVFTKIDGSVGRDKFYTNFIRDITQKFGYLGHVKHKNKIKVYILHDDRMLENDYKKVTKTCKKN
jgi:hypothetical protein